MLLTYQSANNQNVQNCPKIHKQENYNNSSTNKMLKNFKFVVKMLIGSIKRRLRTRGKSENKCLIMVLKPLRNKKHKEIFF